MRKLLSIILLLGMSISAMSQDGGSVEDKSLNHVKATIKVLGNGTAVLVPDDEENTRYASQQLPKEYQQEGLKVSFCGKVGTIPPNVRLMGTPLDLSCICITKEEKKKFGLKKRRYKFN